MKIPWTERAFDFSFPVELARELIVRLEGAPARARWYVSGRDQTALVSRTGDTWSIQENIAHLADTDRDLFLPRLSQFEEGLDRLVPADMTNKATWGADHNMLTIGEVLDRFAAMRTQVIERLDAADDEFFARTARHPRLDQPMRVVDLLYFKAEHDDYHFARVRELLRDCPD